MTSKFKALTAAALLLLGGSLPAHQAAAPASWQQAPASDWLQLFNGRDLSGWDIKIKGRPLNDNWRDTFRVVDGRLAVAYDQYPDFQGQYGHIFYRKPFSHYVVAVEYRFLGSQVKGGEDWAERNNGVMVHSQSAASMGLDQPFPTSLEVQLLGGLGKGPRATANLCTPGTEALVGDKLVGGGNCIDSSSKTYDGDGWVRVEAVVLGDELIDHIVDGAVVLSYRNTRLSEPLLGPHGETLLPKGAPLKSGFIALQAESHPVEFRKVELLDLSGCKDPKAGNYRSYYVAARPGSCRYRDDNAAQPKAR